MKKTFTISIGLLAGIIIGVISTCLILGKQKPQPSNFTVHIANSATKPTSVNYSSDNLPKINLSQSAAINKFRSLYSSAVIKSITLNLNKDIYIYNITGFDDRKDCTIQIDATNNKILGQSTQVLDYNYEKGTSLNLKKTISRHEATEIALKEVNNSTPISWELADDNDQEIWKVVLIHSGHKHTVKINAQTKEVI